MYLQLDAVKKHLVIDSTFTDDDNYLEYLIKVVEQAVSRHLDIPFAKLADERGEIPAPVQHAMLLEIGNLYNHREAEENVSNYEIKHGYEYLISLYKDYKQ